jgi:hypothetical protein
MRVLNVVALKYEHYSLVALQLHRQAGLCRALRAPVLSSREDSSAYCKG